MPFASFVDALPLVNVSYAHFVHYTWAYYAYDRYATTLINCWRKLRGGNAFEITAKDTLYWQIDFWFLPYHGHRSTPSEMPQRNTKFRWQLLASE